jgi:hypothetical protein
MSTETLPSNPAPRRFSIELALVIGLPLSAVIIASSFAFVAYVHGFTEIAPAEIHAPHQR